MKERLLPIALALAALGLFWLLLFPKPMQRGNEAPRPLSTERAAPGLLGLARWLGATHTPVASWRLRYDRLADTPAVVPSRTGNLLVVSMPFDTGMRRGESQALDDWIRAGNTVLVLAALDDTPKWAALTSTNLTGDLQGVTHLHFSTIRPKGEKPGEVDRVREALDALKDTHVSLLPAGHHPMFAGVQSLATHSELPASRWMAVADDGDPVLEVASRTDTLDPAVWIHPRDQGTVIVSGYASVFTNESLGDAGNARWLANLVSLYVGPGGRVVFDDAHQGALDYYDPQRFFADARLHRALGWLLLLWACWVFGTRSLLPALDRERRVDDTALLGVTANFYASALTPAAAGARLCEQFFDSIRRRIGLPENGEPVWEWLDADARVDRAEIAELRRLQERAQAGRRIDLSRLHALLQGLSGKIA